MPFPPPSLSDIIKKGQNALSYSDQSNPSCLLAVVAEADRLNPAPQTWLPIQIESHSSCVALIPYLFSTYCCAFRFCSGLERPLICKEDFQVEEGIIIKFFPSSTEVSRTTPNTLAKTLNVLTLFPTDDCNCISSKAIVSIFHSSAFWIMNCLIVTNRSPTSSWFVAKWPQSFSSPSMKIDHPDTRLA